jgi:hypothetical protein
VGTVTANFQHVKFAVSLGATFFRGLFAPVLDVINSRVLKKAPPRLAGHTLNHTKPKSLYECQILMMIGPKSNESPDETA